MACLCDGLIFDLWLWDSEGATAFFAWNIRGVQKKSERAEKTKTARHITSCHKADADTLTASIVIAVPQAGCGIKCMHILTVL